MTIACRIATGLRNTRARRARLAPGMTVVVRILRSRASIAVSSKVRGRANSGSTSVAAASSERLRAGSLAGRGDGCPPSVPGRVPVAAAA